MVGDITPHDKVPKALKKQMEDDAFKTMVKDLDAEIKQELYDIYAQYDSGTSIEAQIVRDIDKYEMMLQAYQYELKYPSVCLDEFYSESHVIQT